jgi:hypothetical protein
MKKFLAAVLTVLATSVSAVEITGAGATFPYPIYPSGQWIIKKSQVSSSTIKALVAQVVSNRSELAQFTLVPQMHP